MRRVLATKCRHDGALTRPSNLDRRRMPIGGPASNRSRNPGEVKGRQSIWFCVWRDSEMDASDVLVERLLAWGVDTIFGLPGDGINGVFEALRKQKDRIRFIHVRHEEAAAFMACAYAKFTGRLGVCIATSGPGGSHLLNGPYDAKLDHAP